MKGRGGWRSERVDGRGEAGKSICHSLPLLEYDQSTGTDSRVMGAFHDL